ncbi:Low affinity iron permease [Paraphaeosphaeria sporulosa]|uniref:Low affinity iron permease n=1 Tax=Paraphaeosphaeria sporulosa TaxID=1460663 RepID=A0A177CM94_9PLEO|nr:Low affinity iron permease [Paraphaeosphaeria sporulosa]OAG08655.1 Low affinity iron permease [Paraphaeosphaeria sporulosa]
MLSQIFDWLRSPGARNELQFSAPSHIVDDAEAKSANPEKSSHVSVENTDTYAALVKPRLLDRWLDRVVEISGSEYTYVIVLVGLFTWAFLGIHYGTANTYKIIISDAQAIINLVFDAFLMRQQFNQHDNLIMVAGCLRSRISSHKRMIEHLIATGKFTKIDTAKFQTLQQNDFVDRLPQENWLTKVSGFISSFLGHIGTAVGFWGCIFIWLGFGKYCEWSNTWQLYINSATSALMVLLLAFLANVRERHSRYMAECLKAIWKADSALELRLRNLTGDRTENSVIVMPERKRSKVQRAIDYYADLVGTLAGVAFLIIVILIWVACGPPLHFNSSWWLLIGTYAGLVGLNDGFVLRNVCQVLGDYQDEQFIQVNYEDLQTLSAIGVGTPEEERDMAQSLSYRISLRVGYFCSHQWSVVSGVILIFALIAAASALRWSETGQLLCNIPPSVIESFFTLILITGHNVSETKRRVDLRNIYLHRLKVISYVGSQSFAKADEGVMEPHAGDEISGNVLC